MDIIKVQYGHVRRQTVSERDPQDTALSLFGLAVGSGGGGGGGGGGGVSGLLRRL